MPIPKNNLFRIEVLPLAALNLQKTRLATQRKVANGDFIEKTLRN
jgi:hypothetical protein